MAGWSSGWIAAAGNNTDTSFSHNLNSTDVIWQIYVADNMEGLNASIIDMQLDMLQGPSDSLGAMMTNVTDTSFSLSLGVGYVNKAHGHEQSSFDGKFVKVLGFATTTNSVPGTGDLCSLLSADSGYQMFRSGLTIQWASDNFAQEGSRVINFPIAFAAKPFKVVASIRHEGKMPEDTQQWMHVVNWTKDYVTVYCQSHNATEFQIGVDIIAIGIAEVVNCPNSEGSSGTKISNLKKAESLEDSDLFVVSKEVDGDTVYDTSNNVTFEQIKGGVINSIPPVDLNNEFISFISPSICTNGFTNSAGVAGKLTFWHDNEWMHPAFNGLSINLLTKEVYERYYWHRNSGKEAFYSRSNNTFYNPHGYSSPSAVMWDNSTPPTFSTSNAPSGLVRI